MKAAELPRLIRAARDGDATLVVKNARVVNVFTNEVIDADIAVNGDTVIGVGDDYQCDNVFDAKGAYVAPGFIDAHVHIESSMVTPASFASVIVPKGTTTIIADPHEIANVAGIWGIRAIYKLTYDLPMTVYFMLPSCVPSTPYEHSGAKLAAEDLETFVIKRKSRVLGLGEVMDYTSVVDGDDEMLDKLTLFFNRPIDGHAPLLCGRRLNAYCVAGPRTDHECSTASEMKEKLRCGMNVLIRIGSAANGIDEMLDCIVSERLSTDGICFCTDDKHIENILREGHINHIVNTAVKHGIPPIDAIRMATINTARTFALPRVGAIAPGYRADMIVFDDITDIRPKAVFTSGELYDPDKQWPIPVIPNDVYGSVHCAPVQKSDLALAVSNPMPIIRTVDNQLVTLLERREVPTDEKGNFVAGYGLDKLAVIERHQATGNIGLGIVSGLGIHNGAIASTVAHDSHNIVVAGDNDDDMLTAVETLKECGGGYCVVSRGIVLARLPLPIAGLMTDAPVEEVLKCQRALLDAASYLGASKNTDPLIMLSFLALPVIPQVRLTDMGLFDVTTMSFIDRE